MYASYRIGYVVDDVADPNDDTIATSSADTSNLSSSDNNTDDYITNTT